MGRLRFIPGAIGMLAGFFIYQYGLFLELDHLEASLLGLALSSVGTAVVSLFGSSAIAGGVLQLIGGVVAIAGVLACISWLGSQPRILPMPSVARIKSESVTIISANVRKCKFCGTPIESDAAFCPSCQRAQV